ncbi:hypothetical protein [Verminephrobacter eiseniae]|nr:hypothetical protein [Verminephrobacter eiseniae]MCW8191494.1 hypothetical protein [Verminephrobacter eiseniae]
MVARNEIDAFPVEAGRKPQRHRLGIAGIGNAALVSRHRSSVGLRWPSKRIAALHRLPIRSVLAARCALRCAPMAARSLRHLIRDATLARNAPFPSAVIYRPVHGCADGAHHAVA